MDIYILGPEKSALMSATKKGPNIFFKIISYYLVGMASAGLVTCPMLYWLTILFHLRFRMLTHHNGANNLDRLSLSGLVF